MENSLKLGRDVVIRRSRGSTILKDLTINNNYNIKNGKVLCWM